MASLQVKLGLNTLISHRHRHTHTHMSDIKRRGVWGNVWWCGDMLHCQFLAARRRTMLPARQALNSERLHLDGERGVKVHHDLGPYRRASSCKALTPSLWDDLSCRGGFPIVRRHHVESLHNAGCVQICKMSHSRRKITLRGFSSGRKENSVVCRRWLPLRPSSGALQRARRQR